MKTVYNFGPSVGEKGDPKTGSEAKIHISLLLRKLEQKRNPTAALL